MDFLSKKQPDLRVNFVFNYCSAFLFMRNTRDFKSEFLFHCREEAMKYYDVILNIFYLTKGKKR